MNSTKADSLIVKVQFAGYVSHVSWHFQKFGILDSVEYLEFKLLMFQLVDVQRLELEMVVLNIAGQGALGR